MSDVFRKSLFACTSDLGLVVQTLFCPCVVYGKVDGMLATRQIAGNNTGSCAVFFLCLVCCPYINVFMLCTQRGKVRSAFNIQGNCLEDFVYSYCCSACVLGQSQMEVQSRLLPNQVQVIPQMPKGNQVVMVQAVPVGAPEAVSMDR